MAKLDRIVQLLFASNAGVDEIGKFGSLAAGLPATTTDPAEVESLSNFLDGWFGAVVGENSPAIEDMNALFFLLFYQLAYLFQAGVSEWDTDTIYYIGSLVNDGTGRLYVSLTNDNTGNALTDTANWALQEGAIQSKSAAYTVLATDGWVIGNATSAAFDLTIPAAAGLRGKEIKVAKDVLDTTYNELGMIPTGGDTIGGETRQALKAPGDSVTLKSDGVSNWYAF